jgi:ABC-type multidrug transport system fused ATPase/permease subunit
MTVDQRATPIKSDRKDRKDRNPSNTAADFLRATSYLWPHRRIVFTSIFCAFVVAAAFTTGLSTMLPILQVLFKGDSVQAWVDRQVVDDRLGVHLQDNPNQVIVNSITKSKLAAVTGTAVAEPPAPLAPGAVITGINGVELPAVSEATDARDERRRAGAILRHLSDNANPTATVVLATGESVAVSLRPVPWYMQAFQRVGWALPKNPVGSIAAVFGILAGLACFGNFVRFFQEYLADKAAILAVRDVRRQLYDHVLHMPLGYFSLKGTSDATSRLMQDSNGLLEGFKAVLGNAIQEPIKAGFTFTLAMIFSWRLTLFIVLFAPVMAILVHKFGKRVRKANKRALEQSASVLSQLEGSLIGIRVVKAAAAERFERRRYATILDRVIEQFLRMSRIDAMSSPVLESLTLLLAGVIILYAAYLVFEVPAPNNLDPNRFIMVMACLVGMADSLRKVTKVNNSLQKANAAAGRIFETLSVPVERRRTARGAKSASRQGLAEQTVKLAPIQREIRFENVVFTYPGASHTALSGVDLTVKKGTSVAVVGRNGSGKTTLLALLPRFYDPGQGRITVDGIDIRQATLRSLRQQIGIVTQDSVVFPGTIESNIAYGFSIPDGEKDPAGRKEFRARVVDAATRAFAHDFVTEKGGYDVVLGEHGTSLSGGQKQRLCIARAIFRNSPILILDEATSQVDAESEHLIQQAIEQVMHERTTFVIAHRFSTILSADVIVVIERGKIVGQGKHEELLVSCPIYRQLYERQLFVGGAVPASEPVG